MPAFNAAAFADLKPGLIAELIAKDGMNPAKAEAAVTDYGRFLALVSDEKPTCPPSLANDGASAWSMAVAMRCPLTSVSRSGASRHSSEPSRLRPLLGLRHPPRRQA